MDPKIFNYFMQNKFQGIIPIPMTCTLRLFAFFAYKSPFDFDLDLLKPIHVFVFSNAIWKSEMIAYYAFLSLFFSVFFLFCLYIYIYIQNDHALLNTCLFSLVYFPNIILGLRLQ